MSVCYCGRVEIPLGMTMCTKNHVTHGVTACVGAGMDWGMERRAEAAEAEVERLTTALADRDATIQRVRDELQGVTVALAQGCLCHGDVCSGKCGRGTPWAWNLDPERITAALAPKAGGETA